MYRIGQSNVSYTLFYTDIRRAVYSVKLYSCRHSPGVTRVAGFLTSILFSEMAHLQFNGL